MAVAIKEIGPVSNDAEEAISSQYPYAAFVRLRGTADLLFHRWSNEEVDSKSKAAKGSKAKKTDNVESYIYRCDNGNIGIPGEYVRMAIINAAKFRQDPRSPRKSAMDLFKAGVVSLTELSDLGKAEWDYEDRRRVTVQRAGITRCRPAFKAGWEADFELAVLLPEYIDRTALSDTIGQAGRLIGIGDFRPTYGRFEVVEFKIS